VVLMTTAWPVAFSAGRAAELMLYVPRTSISMTVLKPFGERDSPIEAGTVRSPTGGSGSGECAGSGGSGGAGKVLVGYVHMPAAPLISTFRCPKLSTAVATAAAQSSGLRTSPALKVQVIPSARKFSQASSRKLARRPKSTSLAPCRPSCWAIT